MRSFNMKKLIIITALLMTVIVIAMTTCVSGPKAKKEQPFAEEHFVKKNR